MAQINHGLSVPLKADGGQVDSEKAVLNMTMDDLLSLPGITVAEIRDDQCNQKAVKAGKIITLLGGGEI